MPGTQVTCTQHDFHMSLIIACACLWSISFLVLSVYSVSRVSSLSSPPLPTCDEASLSRLQTLWTAELSAGRNNAGVYLHSFDDQSGTGEGVWNISNPKCGKGTSFAWCPPEEVVQYHLPTPLNGISFTVVQRNITRKYGRPLCCAGTEYGLAFAFDKAEDQSISPMCYFPVDGSSQARGKCGCGQLGLQFEFSCPVSDDGYDLHDCTENASAVSHANPDNCISPYGDGVACTHKAIVQTKFPYTAFQCSQNYDTFATLATYTRDVVQSPDSPGMGWNEVVIRSWYDVDFHKVPLVAFFYAGGNRSHFLRVVHEFYTVTGMRHIPVVEFDPDDGFKCMT